LSGFFTGGARGWSWFVELLLRGGLGRGFWWFGEMGLVVRVGKERGF